jgi:REP element-mobilizing transposase RayT
MSQIPTQLKQENLAEIIADSSVFAAVLLKSGEVQTQTRSLPPKGLIPIQNALQRYWLGTARTDLNRYIGLEIDSRYYFLFVEKVNQANDVIALIFPLEIPLIRIRREMTSLVKKILNFKAPAAAPQRQQSISSEVSKSAQKAKTPAPSSKQQEKDEEEDPLEQTLQFLFKSFPEPDPEDNDPLPDNSWQPETFNSSSEEKKEKIVPEESSPLPKNEAPSSDPIPRHQKPQPQDPNLINNEEGFQEFPLGTDLITPKSKHPQKPILPVKEDPKEDVDNIPLTLIPPEDDVFASDETGPIRVTLPDEDENDWQPLNELPVQDEDLASILQDDFDLDKKQHQEPAADGFATLDDDVFDTEELNEETETTETEEDNDEEDSLLAEILAGEKEDAQSMDAVSDVTFYLVPRLAHHYILGELAHRLRRWVPKICQAFGWRLDTLSVRPDYLKWTFNDFPEAATKDMLQIMRRQTSDRIFRDFPSLQVENQTGDYWSPSYLVDKENRYFSTQALMSFVSKTRFEDEDSL